MLSQVFAKMFSDAHKVEKHWGYELWLTNRPKYCAKILELKPGKKCSLHRHRDKEETFIVIEGALLLQVGAVAYPDLRYMSAGDSYDIAPKTYHRFSSRTGATILEISTHHSDEDVERLEDSGDL